MNPLSANRGTKVEERDGRGRAGEALLGDRTPLAIEPLTDFSREEARRALRGAVEQVARQFGQVYPPVIGNEAVSTPATFDSLNPSHKRQVVGRCGRATPEQAAQAVAAAAEAFPAWRDTDPERRADFLFEAARVMKRRRFELAAWQVHECGKQWREADADVAEAIDYCNYYGREMLHLARPRRRGDEAAPLRAGRLGGVRVRQAVARGRRRRRRGD